MSILWDLELAHSFCNNNKPALLQERLCGCFHCLEIFDPKEIEEYVEVDTSIDCLGTAICPYCQVDSIIPESSGFPITRDFLLQMSHRWFHRGGGIELDTPFGTLKVLLDGEPIAFIYAYIEADDELFPDVDGTYRITADFEPDGKAHELALVLCSDKIRERYSESGERLEAETFLSCDGKITLGCIGSFQMGQDNEYDYDGNYLENGIVIEIYPNTKTTTFRFGACWMMGEEKDKHSQTWYGSDPGLYLYPDICKSEDH